MSLVAGHRGTCAVAVAILLSSSCLVGCTGGTAARKLTHAVASGKATAGHAVTGGKAVIDSFTAKLQSGAAMSFEAKYFAGVGRKPAEIVYAIRPPDGLVFEDIAMPGGKEGPGTQIVVNGSGEYLCTRRGGHARWACRQLGKASAAVHNTTFGIYTVAHWVAFLKAFALAPGFARYHISTFTTMGGRIPALRTPATGWNCLDFSPPGTHGIDVICAAGPGILGLVMYHATTIMIESYTPSPPASLFALPPGAKIIKPQAGAG